MAAIGEIHPIAVIFVKDRNLQFIEKVNDFDRMMHENIDKKLVLCYALY